MKKILILSIVFIVLAIFTTTVNAVTADTIVNDIYELGKKYGVTEADKLRGERYLADNPITDEQANQRYEKALKALSIFDKANATDVKKLNKQMTTEEKNQFRTTCQEGADIIGVTLTYRNGAVDIYKDGKKIDTYTFTDGKLPYTGNTLNIVIVVSSVALIALATFFIAKKKSVNA